MNVSAVNCTPIKPQVSFGNDQDSNKNYDHILSTTKDLNDQLIHSDQIKKPLAIAGSLGLAGLTAFVMGQKLATPISKITFNKGKENAKTLASCFENTLKHASHAVKNAASKLGNDGSTKIGKVKNAAGKAIGKAEELARGAYKKIAYSGIANNAEASDKAAKAFQNVVGIACVPTALAAVSSKDADGNGLSDIMQNDVNPYDKTKDKMDKYVHNAYVLTELLGDVL